MCHLMTMRPSWRQCTRAALLQSPWTRPSHPLGSMPQVSLQASFSSHLCFATAIPSCGRSDSIGSGDREKSMPQGCGSIKAVSSHVGVGKEVLGCVRPKEHHCQLSMSGDRGVWRAQVPMMSPTACTRQKTWTMQWQLSAMPLTMLARTTGSSRTPGPATGESLSKSPYPNLNPRILWYSCRRSTMEVCLRALHHTALLYSMSAAVLT